MKNNTMPKREFPLNTSCAKLTRVNAPRSYCVFFERDGHIDSQLVGGKGSSLIDMTRLGLPVPPGFIITTDVWNKCQRGSSFLSPEIWNTIEHHLEHLEQKTGMRLGDEKNPLFVSVRSGAEVSMPGILDTKLNIGLNKQTALVLKEIIGAEATNKILQSMPANFPQDPQEQICVAIQEVYNSWNSPKAIAYRQKNGIPEIGTAVTIQLMVWGNSLKKGAGTGVLLTRDTQKFSTHPVVIFAPHAQGPEVVNKYSLYPQVSIDRLPIPKQVCRQLMQFAQLLECHYRFIPQDIEFTYDGKHLWFLQTREAPLSPLANFRSIRNRIQRGCLTEEAASRTIPPAHLSAIVESELNPKAVKTAEKAGRLLTKGISVSVGNRMGRLVFSLQEAVNRGKNPEKIVLADSNIESFSQLPLNVEAVLLDKAGIGSHLAREGTQISSEKNIIAIFGASIDKKYAGEIVTVDGNTGKVYLGAVPSTYGKTENPLLKPQERKIAHAWLSKKRKNPWQFAAMLGGYATYVKTIKRALSQAERDKIHSLKAREITGFNAAIPRNIRQHYTIVKCDTEEVLIRKIKPILNRIFTSGHHATIRTCHTPALPANGPWALVRNMKDFERFVSDDHYSEKYGGFRNFLSNPQLTELLVGDIPIGKMERDPIIQYQHCAWTLSCAENGAIILQIHPHDPQLRGHEKAKREDLITFTTHCNLKTSNQLASIHMEIGENLIHDSLARELADIVKEAIFYTWWIKFELPQRMAAVTSVFGVNASFEGQATKEWCLGYGIKTE